MPSPDPKQAPQTRVEHTVRSTVPGESDRLIETMSEQGWRVKGEMGLGAVFGIGTVEVVFERTVSMDGTLFWDGAQWRHT
jgi:hypothetical protein